LNLCNLVSHTQFLSLLSMLRGKVYHKLLHQPI